MRVVLDSSATLAWIFGDEITDEIRRLYEQIADDGALVPSLWRLEVANALTIAIRRGRIETAFRDAALRDLALLDVATDPHTMTRAWVETLHLADAHLLTVYDAAYLELALRHSLPLASLDRDLCAAAMKAGVPLLLAVRGE